MTQLKRIAKGAASLALTRLLGDQQGFVVLATRRGPAKGLRFRLELRTRMEYSYWFGSYELPIVQALAGLCKPGWIAWDCGTFLGYYTCLFARLVGPAGQVVAFEPDPNNLDRTKQNAALNGFTNILFEQAAIGSSCGETDFVISPNTNSHIPGVYVGASYDDYLTIESGGSFQRVHCISLDEALRSTHLPRPDIIKIDIEGAEITALQYTDHLCREVRPLIVLELHNPECDRAAWEWGQKQNYRLKSLNTGRLLTRLEDVHGTLLCSPVGSVTDDKTAIVHT